MEVGGAINVMSDSIELCYGVGHENLYTCILVTYDHYEVHDAMCC